MREKIFVYSGSGTSKVLVNDPERSADYATGLHWNSIWPKGYGEGGFTVARQLARTWAIQEAQEIVVRDGNTIVYQGRLELKHEKISSGAESVDVEMSGWYTVLAQRKLRHRYADLAISRFRARDPNGAGAQNISVTQGDDNVTFTFAAGADRYSAPTDFHALQYVMPAGRTVKRIQFNWEIENDGEGVVLTVVDVDHTSEDTVASVVADDSGAYSQNFASPPRTVEIRVYGSDADYETTDLVRISGLLIRGLDIAAITAYDVITDILAEVGDEISGDYDQIADPATTLTSFITQGDGFETADSIIQRANGFSDASQNVYGLAVWDETGTSDRKARAVNSYRDVSDYEWLLSLADCISYSMEPAIDKIYNYIYVRFTDNDLTDYRTPLENANLKNQASIDQYGRRDLELDVGDASSAMADSFGERVLEYSKEPLAQAEFVLRGRIRNKAGIAMPVNRVRAGQRVKLLDKDTIYFLRQVDYNADDLEVKLYPDLPPNRVDIQLTQMELVVKGRATQPAQATRGTK